jgi:hypothetical protein
MFSVYYFTMYPYYSENTRPERPTNVKTQIYSTLYWTHHYVLIVQPASCMSIIWTHKLILDGKVR